MLNFIEKYKRKKQIRKTKEALYNNQVISLCHSEFLDEYEDLLIELAYLEGATILVGSQKWIKIIRESADRLGVNVHVLGFAPNFTHTVVRGTFPKGVVIHESVERELYELVKNELPNIQIKGGFTYID